jgi:hypothetical protein
MIIFLFFHFVYCDCSTLKDEGGCNASQEDCYFFNNECHPTKAANCELYISKKSCLRDEKCEMSKNKCMNKNSPCSFDSCFACKSFSDCDKVKCFWQSYSGVYGYFGCQSTQDVGCSLYGSEFSCKESNCTWQSKFCYNNQNSKVNCEYRYSVLGCEGNDSCYWVDEKCTTDRGKKCNVYKSYGSCEKDSKCYWLANMCFANAFRTTIIIFMVVILLIVIGAIASCVYCYCAKKCCCAKTKSLFF